MGWIVPVIELIVGGVGLGQSIHSMVSQPSAPKGPTTEQINADAMKKKQTQEAALTQQFPSIQSQTGGALSPEMWLRLSELLSNQAGTPGIGAAGQDILQKLFGRGENEFMVSAGNTVTPSSTPGLTSAGSTFG